MIFKKDIIIVGGGAAGLFAAATAVDGGASVAILEKNERCGRKIAITGKGRCNLTNTAEWEEFRTHIHPDGNFFRPAFFGMSNAGVMSFFESIGLPLTEERGKRVFPASHRACDVADILVSYCRKKGVEIISGCEIKSIERKGNGYVCHASYMTDSDAKFYSGKLIIATGGLSYPRTGSTGDGYLFAESLGHCVTKRLPSLTALLPENYDRSLEGISLKNISLTLTINGNTASSEFGDMDFTDGGIEGPLGFKLSRKAVSALSDGQKVDIILDLKPAVSDEKLSARILRELKGMGISTVDFTPDVTRKLLARLMPLALIRPFLKANGNLSSENIVSSLKNWKMHIVSNVGYERCVVTAGGVSLKEISRKTMESKFSPGLYFAGEVMDLDGDTGGYNLQIAFSTGALAAKSAVSSLAKEQ